MGGDGRPWLSCDRCGEEGVQGECWEGEGGPLPRPPTAGSEGRPVPVRCCSLRGHFRFRVEPSFSAAHVKPPEQAARARGGRRGEPRFSALRRSRGSRCGSRGHRDVRGRGPALTRRLDVAAAPRPRRDPLRSPLAAPDASGSHGVHTPPRARPRPRGASGLRAGPAPSAPRPPRGGRAGAGVRVGVAPRRPRAPRPSRPRRRAHVPGDRPPIGSIPATGSE